MTRILGLAGGSEAGGRTATAVAGILAGAAGQGAETELRELSQTALPDHRGRGCVTHWRPTEGASAAVPPDLG